MYHYTECGLPNVYLANGRPSLALQEIDGLHSAIGKLLVQKTRALDGAEVRFLRTEMGMFQEALGERLGVCKRTVLRWEKQRSRIPAEADLSLRLLYLQFLECPCPREALERVMTTGNKSSRSEPIVLEKDHRQWCLSGQY